MTSKLEYVDNLSESSGSDGGNGGISSEEMEKVCLTRGSLTLAVPKVQRKRE